MCADLPGLKTLAEINAKYKTVKDDDDDDDDDDVTAPPDDLPPRGLPDDHPPRGFGQVSRILCE